LLIVKLAVRNERQIEGLRTLVVQMSRDLGISYASAVDLVTSAPYRYKSFQIPKKNGGFRKISQPDSDVKLAQKWVVETFLSKCPVHACATAYRNNISILDNALPHIESQYLEKFDFSNFFPSIKVADFENFMREHVPLFFSFFSDGDLKDMARILFHFDRGQECGANPFLPECDSFMERAGLAIGAPSSPILSNILLYQFDCKVSDFCKGIGINYTRYADDLAFSYDIEPELNLETVLGNFLSSLNYPSFLRLNSKKHFKGSRKGVRIVTGLILTSDGRTTIGRNRKRRLRSAVKHFLDNELSPVAIRQLSGWLAFCSHVEPELVKKLEHSYQVKDLFSQVKLAVKNNEYQARENSMHRSFLVRDTYHRKHHHMSGA
jgi:hypothetical protein